jgi:hypothetical protein
MGSGHALVIEHADGRDGIAALSTWWRPLSCRLKSSSHSHPESRRLLLEGLPIWLAMAGARFFRDAFISAAPRQAARDD